MSVGMLERGQRVESSIEFTSFKKALKKHGLKVLLFTALVTVACIPLVMHLSVKYVSTATVLIKAQQDNATPIESVDGYDSTRGPYYSTQYSLMESRVVLERAILALKLSEDARYNGDKPLVDGQTEWRLSEQERMEATLEMVRRHLNISEVRLTQLVHVTYEDSDASEAARIANGIAQAFIDYTVEKKLEKTQTAQEWNEEQTNQLRQQVASKKKEMEAFLNQSDLITFQGVDGFETQQLSILTERLANATERRINAQAQYELILEHLDAPLEDVASIPEISSHPQLQDLRIALIQAKRELYDLRNRYGPKHNKIIEAQAQISAIETQTHHLLKELKLGLYKEYRAQLTKENRYKALLKVQKDNFKTLVTKRDQYESMQTDLEKTQDLYQQLFIRAKEQSLTAMYQEPDAVIYDPAVMAIRPQKPNKTLLLAMVFVLSFSLAILYVIIRSALDQKITMLDQIPKKLGLKPLADLPDFPTSDERDELVALICANQFAMETFHGLKTAIHLNAPTAYTLGVVSSTKNEGASLITQLLADSLSLNHKTLLVDLDYRSDNALSLQDAYRVENDEGYMSEPDGVAQWVYGNKDSSSLIVPLNEKCDFLPRGKLNQSPLVLFSHENFAHTMQQCGENYERVVVNLPCLSDSKDTQLAAQSLDGVVVVLRAGQRDAPAIRQDVLKLQHKSVVTIGAILNRVQTDDLKSEESHQFSLQGSFSTLFDEN